MNIYDKVKDLAKLAKKLNDQEFYEKIVGLRDEILSLKNENVELKEKLQEYEKRLSKKKNFKHDGLKYRVVDDKGDVLESQGAYCPTCLDNCNKEIRLLEYESGYYWCNVCKKTYGRWNDKDGTVQLVPGTRRVRRTKSFW